MAGDTEPTEQVVTVLTFDGEALAERTSMGKVGVKSTVKAILESMPHPTTEDLSRYQTALDEDPEYQQITAQLQGLSKYKNTKRERLERRRTVISRRVMTLLIPKVPEIIAVECEVIE